MDNPRPSDYEIIDQILAYLYNDGEDIDGNVKDFISAHGWSFTNREYELFIRKYVNTGWVSYNLAGGTYLEKYGVDMYERYGSYSEFIRITEMAQAEKLKKEKKEALKKKWIYRLDFVLSRTNSTIAIFATTTTIILAIFSLSDREERKTLTKEKEQLTKERDSLIQVISNTQKKPDSTKTK